MYEQFEKAKQFSACLITNDVRQNECDVQFTYNPYDLNNMEVEIFDAPELDIPNFPDRPSFADYSTLDV